MYVVGSPGRQHWQHVYTAVTRGRCRVYVIAEEQHLRRAITNKNVPRKTRLQRFLREAIAETSRCPSQPSSALVKSWQNPNPETQPVSLAEGGLDPPEPLTDLTERPEFSAAALSEERQKGIFQSPHKRQQMLLENSEDAAKVPSVSSSLLKKPLHPFTTRLLVGLVYYCDQ